jgi:hypothetical protein
MDSHAAAATPFAEMLPCTVYLGYVDLLGFKALVRSDYDRAKRIYDEILRKSSLLPEKGAVQSHPGNVSITAASDSFFVVGEHLQDVANWSSGIQVAALREGLLARGSIAYGRHLQQDVHESGGSRHHTLVVSEALVLAASDEEHRKEPPCGVTLSPSVPQSAIQELDREHQRARQRAIIFKSGRWIANPFGADVVLWIRPLLVEMLARHRCTPYRPKYQWMLDLFEDVYADKLLTP